MTLIHETLRLASDAPITLASMRVDGWGRTLIFEGIAAGKWFVLTFDDCREMRWRVYAHQAVDMPTPLVEFHAGRDLHRSPAQLLTEHFGLSLFYGSLTVTTP